MGYYTDYDLTAERYRPGGNRYPLTDDAEIERLEAELAKMDVFEGIDLKKGYCYCNAKWYDHDKDMQLLSGILFTLHGIGEESEDLWNAYYLNGLMQYCPAEIHYAEFDPAKMNDNGFLDDLNNPSLHYSYEQEKYPYQF